MIVSDLIATLKAKDQGCVVRVYIGGELFDVAGVQFTVDPTSEEVAYAITVDDDEAT